MSLFTWVLTATTICEFGMPLFNGCEGVFLHRGSIITHVLCVLDKIDILLKLIQDFHNKWLAGAICLTKLLLNSSR